MQINPLGARLALIALVLPLVGVPSSAAAKWKSRGEVAIESRAFDNDDIDGTEDYGLGMFGRVRVDHKHKPFRQRFRAYGRMDRQDSGRAIFVVEEGWGEMKTGPFRLRAGLDIVNWTATEAFHPADVLNSRNLDSDVESYEKVGEPMIAATVDFGPGTLAAYYMPFYTNPILPSSASRLSFAPPEIQLGEPLRLDRDGELTDERWGPQGALRYRQTIGSADVSLHVLHHLDRHQPDIVFDAEALSPRLMYRTVTQVGGTYQHAIEGILIKLEGAHRMFHNPSGLATPYGPLRERDHTQVAAGIEYGWAHDNGSESMLILEGQSLFGVGKRKRANLHIFQRDVLLGFRFALNDSDSKSLLASIIVDVERAEEFMAALSYSQRLSETWSVAAAIRWIHAPRKGVLTKNLELLDDSDHVRLTLTRHF